MRKIVQPVYTSVLSHIVEIDLTVLSKSTAYPLQKNIF